MSALKMVVVVCFLALVTVASSQFCGTSGPYFRNYNHTCPAMAVCADVYDGVRDWMNGTTCNHRRIINNCLCPGNMVCPYNNPDHMVHYTSYIKMYTCEPACDIAWCDNARHRRYAMTSEYNSPDFGNRNYYKMFCRCKGHVVQPPPRKWAVVSSGIIREIGRFNRRLATKYDCDDTWVQNGVENPCT